MRFSGRVGGDTTNGVPALRGSAQASRLVPVTHGHGEAKVKAGMAVSAGRVSTRFSIGGAARERIGTGAQAWWGRSELQVGVQKGGWRRDLYPWLRGRVASHRAALEFRYGAALNSLAHTDSVHTSIDGGGGGITRVAPPANVHRSALFRLITPQHTNNADAQAALTVGTSVFTTGLHAHLRPGGLADCNLALQYHPSERTALTLHTQDNAGRLVGALRQRVFHEQLGPYSYHSLHVAGEINKRLGLFDAGDPSPNAHWAVAVERIHKTDDAVSTLKAKWRHTHDLTLSAMWTLPMDNAKGHIIANLTANDSAFGFGITIGDV
jgi:hypothetical protein